MNNIEIENFFNKWPGNPLKVEYLSQFEAARDAWFAAWEASLAVREQDFLRARIMDKAVAAFREGRDATARVYRELADELFNKPENTP